jgi:hypothetical protein
MQVINETAEKIHKTMSSLLEKSSALETGNIEQYLLITDSGMPCIAILSA